MILSASRRTDIPAFYTPWFMNRIREGFLLVRNPFNAHQISTPIGSGCNRVLDKKSPNAYEASG